MAIAEHASTPPVKRSASLGTATTITTAAFSPPAGSLLVCTAVNELQNNPASQPTRTISDSTGGTWTQVLSRPGAVASNYGQMSIWIRSLSAAATNMTVTVDRGTGAAADTVVAVRVLTGANPDQTGAAVASGASQEIAGSLLGGNITTTATGSWVYVAAGMGGGDSPTAKAGTTTLDQWHDTANNSEILFGRLTSPTGTPGSTAVGWNRANTVAADSVWGAVEILPLDAPSGAATATLKLAASTSGGKNASGSSSATSLKLAASATGAKNAAASSSATALKLAAPATGVRASGGSPNAATMILSASATGQVINAVFATLRLAAVLTATGRPGAGAVTAALRLTASETAAPRNAANSAAADPLRLAATAQSLGRHLGSPSAGLLRLQASAAGVMQAQGSPLATLRLSASATGIHAGVSARTAAVRLGASTSGTTRDTAGVAVSATVRLAVSTAAASTRQNSTSAALRLFAIVEGHRVITAIARQVLIRPAPTTSYELVCVARVMQPSGPPVYLQVDPIDWTGLSYSEELSKVPQLNVGCQITGLTEPILQRLRKPAELPTELWLYRNGRLVFSGPLVTGQVQEESLTLNAQGALGYLRLMEVVADLVFANVDQFQITTGLIDQWQTLPYGNFGIDTSSLAPSGVTRDATYLQKELHNVGQRVEELGLRENGFDIWVDPASRKLQLAYPQRGVDRSTGEDAIVFDERNIVSPNIMFSVAPGDVASEAFGTGTGNSTIYSTKSNTDLRAQYGRSAVTGTFDGVSEQTTLDDHVQGLLAARATALLVPGPDVRVTPDSDIGGWDVGDTVSYTMHNLLSVAGAFRLRKRTVTVSKTGQEAVSVGFV